MWNAAATCAREKMQEHFRRGCERCSAAHGRCEMCDEGRRLYEAMLSAIRVSVATEPTK